MDLPQFKSLEEALRWVYYDVDAEGTVAPSAVSRMQGRDRREQIDEQPAAVTPRYDLERRLRGIDARGQAGMVRSYLKRQPDDVRAHLFAQYLRGRDKSMAIALVAHLIADGLDCGEVRHAVVHQLCRRFYGHGVKFNHIQKRHQIGRYRLATVWRRTWITLDALQARVEGPIQDYLREQGLLL